MPTATGLRHIQSRIHSFVFHTPDVDPGQHKPNNSLSGFRFFSASSYKQDRESVTLACLLTQLEQDSRIVISLLPAL